MTTIAIPARLVSDADDCLAAAAALVVAAIPGTKGWDLSPRWDLDDDQDSVLVDVPDVEIEDLAEDLSTEAAARGDVLTVALCRLATEGDLVDIGFSVGIQRDLDHLGIDASKLDAADRARAAIARKVVLG